MLFKLSDLRGLSVRADDGAVGSIDDTYFDDATWDIRYAVADTGTWLSGRKVLLAPSVLGTPDFARGELPAALRRDQVAESPHVDTNRPVSRQQESRLHEYYGWAPYWAGPIAPAIPPLATAPGYAYAPTTAKGRGATDRTAEEVEARARESADPHLRSAREVIGYYISAKDGNIGHVEDFLGDADRWAIRYMIVDTRNWLPGKKVLVSPQWIESVSWTDKQVRVDLGQDQIRNSPEYDPARAIDRTYEGRLFNYYGRVPYWE